MIINILAKHSIKPATIGVERDYLYHLLRPVAKEVGFNVDLLVTVPTIRRLRLSMPF